MEFWGLPLVALASFLAGAVNAIAGGGTFLTFPALVAAGLPPIAANATSAVGVLPGYVSAAFGFRREIAPVHGMSPWVLSAVGLLGGLAGAVLLLVTPAKAFDVLVPWLLLGATLLFAFAPSIVKRAKGGALVQSRPAAVAALFVVSVYGGYFNGGLGIVLLAAFGLIGMTDLGAMNGLKNLLSAVMAAIAAVAFALAGLVDWPQAAVIMVASTMGGHAGAVLSRHLPPDMVRIGIVAVGAAMSVAFFLQTGRS